MVGINDKMRSSAELQADIDYIEVVNNKDDGMEFFGGTVNCENLFLYNNEDDSVDWTEGFHGYLRNVVVIQNQPDADSGIEADNWEYGFDNLPRSMPKIYNATFIGNHQVSVAPGHGNRYRRGTGCISRNFIVMNFGGKGIRVDDAETYALFGEELQWTNGIVYGNADNFGGDDATAVEDWILDPTSLNRVIDPMLADPLNTLVPNVTPLPGSPGRAALGGSTVTPGTVLAVVVRTLLLEVVPSPAEVCDRILEAAR